VGGGDGTLLAAILGANPSTTGLLFDSAPTVGQAKARLEDAGVADRCQVEAGDFFVAVPEGGDTYLLKNVLHDWSDAQSTAILRNCRRAMSTSSRLLVMTLLRDEDAAGDVGAAISDIEMMLLTRGRERTLAEYGDLLGSAGFRTGQSHLVAHPPAYYVVEAHPE
jgi:orsellinic acid C2-O-methyltransferase